MGLHNRCPLNTSGQQGHHIIFTLCRYGGGRAWVRIGWKSARWLCGSHWSRINKAISELKCHKSDGRKTTWPHTVCIFSCSAGGLKGWRTENRRRSILKTKVECWSVHFMKMRLVWTHMLLPFIYSLSLMLDYCDRPEALIHINLKPQNMFSYITDPTISTKQPNHSVWRRNGLQQWWQQTS